LTWAVRFFNSDKSMPSGWHAFYTQVGQYLQTRYQVELDSAWQTVLQVNTAAMPDDAVQYPYQIELAHDFTTYFKGAVKARTNAEESTKEQTFKTLASMPPASMIFTDPNRLSSVDLNSAQYDSHQYFWELHSAVARPKSLAEFAA